VQSVNLIELVDRLRGGLIVSCQALTGEPLFGAQHMAVMACAAVAGGAVAIRANGPTDIAAIRTEISLPIIGLFKVDLPGCEIRITPTCEYAERVAEAGADLIALDATNRPHPGGVGVGELIQQVQRCTGKPVLADVSTLEEGLAAACSGAEFVATTLSGYTAYSQTSLDPDFMLIEHLAAELKPLGVPLLAEGRIITPEQAVRALSLGAHAVVVGGAITRPQAITARFVEALQKGGPA